MLYVIFSFASCHFSLYPLICFRGEQMWFILLRVCVCVCSSVWETENGLLLVVAATYHQQQTSRDIQWTVFKTHKYTFYKQDIYTHIYTLALCLLKVFLWTCISGCLCFCEVLSGECTVDLYGEVFAQLCPWAFWMCVCVCACVRARACHHTPYGVFLFPSLCVMWPPVLKPINPTNTDSSRTVNMSLPTGITPSTFKGIFHDVWSLASQSS